MTATLYGLDDGYTESRYVSELKGVHGSLSFKYRPMSPDGVALLKDQLRKLDGKDDADVQMLRMHKRFLVGQIVEWDARTPDGQEISVEKAMEKGIVPPSLLVRLVRIVLYNLEGGDESITRDQGTVSDDELGQLYNKFITLEDQKKT